MSESPKPQRTAGRIAAIDVARGVALIAMAIYHFTWDLEFFGYADPGLTAQGGWKLFARCIASSFLFLAGVSLWLAHRNGTRWPAFWKRWVLVAGAAALITLATYFATPQAFVFFGILHQIALASLLGLAFMRLPALLVLAIAAGTIALPYAYAADLFNHPSLWWVGLSSLRPRSNDYVPLFPWFGAVLVGIAAAKLAEAAGFFQWLRGRSMPRWSAALGFLGQHSLAFYLLHQPALIGLLWLFSQVAPAAPVPPEIRFMAACQASCNEMREAAFCTTYCACMKDEVAADNSLDTVLGSSQTEAQRQALQDKIMMCTYRSEDELAEPTTP